MNNARKENLMKIKGEVRTYVLSKLPIHGRDVTSEFLSKWRPSLLTFRRKYFAYLTVTANSQIAFNLESVPVEF